MLILILIVLFGSFPIFFLNFMFHLFNFQYHLYLKYYIYLFNTNNLVILISEIIEEVV